MTAKAVGSRQAPRRAAACDRIRDDVAELAQCRALERHRGGGAASRTIGSALAEVGAEPEDDRRASGLGGLAQAVVEAPRDCAGLEALPRLPEHEDLHRSRDRRWRFGPARAAMPTARERERE